MKKQVTIFCITLLLSAAPGLVSAQSGHRIKSSSGANMRKGPGTNHTALASIPAGANVKVLEKNSDGWYKVEYNGQTGYVAGELVENNQNNDQASSPNRPSGSDNSRASQSSGSNRSASSASNNGGQRSQNNNRTASKSSSKGSNAGSSSSYNWGVGLRLGEPSGLTVKRYLSSGNALEISLGRSSRWGYKYDDEDFYKMDKYGDREYYRFDGYKSSFSTALQVHYLWQKPIKSTQGLSWYFGLGGQARFTPVRYSYYHYDGWWKYTEERRTDIDLGLDGVIGIEYMIPRSPISLFTDVNLFVEIVDHPMFMFGQGGIGARYNF
jgi:uncharacterized protein YraI